MNRGTGAGHINMLSDVWFSRIAIASGSTKGDSMSTTSQATSAVEPLRATLGEQVIAPGDAEYEQARLVFMPQFDRRPAAIVRPVDAEGVAAVVTHARDQG